MATQKDMVRNAPAEIGTQKIWNTDHVFLQVQRLINGYSLRRICLICVEEQYHSDFQTQAEKLSKPVIPYFVKHNEHIEDGMLGNIAKTVSQCDAVVMIGNAKLLDLGKLLRYYFVRGEKKCPRFIAVPTVIGDPSASESFVRFLKDEKNVTLKDTALLPDDIILCSAVSDMDDIQTHQSAILGALSKAVEAYWFSAPASSNSRYAGKAITAITENFRQFLDGDEQALFEIKLAGIIAGRIHCDIKASILTPFSEALHKNAGIPDGYAAALCLPSIWSWLAGHADSCSGQIQTALQTINDYLDTETAGESITKIYALLYHLDLPLSAAQRVSPPSLGVPDGIRLTSADAQTIWNDILSNQNHFVHCHELAPHKQLSLQALLWLDKFCKGNELVYFLLGGASIGAERHRGFLPWNAELDVGIRLMQYDRFRELLKKSLPSGFVWESYDEFDDFPYFYGRITYEERVCLNLYPVAATSGDDQKSRRHLRRFQLYYCAYLHKIGYHPDEKLSLHKGLWAEAKALSVIWSKEALTKQIVKTMRLYEDKETGAERYLNICGHWAWEKAILEKEWVETDFPHLTFEGHPFPVLYHNQEYLRRTYGNYMEMPSLHNMEKR